MGTAMTDQPTAGMRGDGGGRRETWPDAEEQAIRNAAVLEALKTHPPDAASMWARAVLMLGRAAEMLVEPAPPTPSKGQEP